MPILMRLLRPVLMAAYHLLYHQMAWSYDLVAWLVSAGHWQRWVLAVIPLLRGPRVLELGYGPGHLQAALAGSGLEIHGVDKSAQMARKAVSRLMKGRKEGSKNNRQVNGYAHLMINQSNCLVRADALALPYPSGVFDTIVATFPAPYIFEPQALAEIRRALAPRGRLVILLSADLSGAGLLLNLARWLLRVDGQPGQWQAAISQRFEAAGLAVSSEWLTIGDNRLMFVFASPNQG